METNKNAETQRESKNTSSVLSAAMRASNALVECNSDLYKITISTILGVDPATMMRKFDPENISMEAAILFNALKKISPQLAREQKLELLNRLMLSFPSMTGGMFGMALEMQD
jgi:hypothetical protein